MTDFFGPMPKLLTLQWLRSSKYFRDNGELINTMISGSPGTNCFGPEENLFKQHKSNKIAKKECPMLELLRYVLRYKSKERPSVKDALKYTWLGITSETITVTTML